MLFSRTATKKVKWFMEGGTGMHNNSGIIFLLNESVRPWLIHCHRFLVSLRIIAEKGFKSIWSSLEMWEVWHIQFAREKVIFLSAINGGLKSFNSIQVKHQKLKLESYNCSSVFVLIPHPLRAPVGEDIPSLKDAWRDALYLRKNWIRLA